jgi:hypothetical protein
MGNNGVRRIGSVALSPSRGRRDGSAVLVTGVRSRRFGAGPGRGMPPQSRPLSGAVAPKLSLSARTA